ncbi:uncharacterized protein [Procambarus clarkii]|uniref:uncharacterized protein n=1 Tax=Procambarus clarkii TaxID=6728 RepID=UPI0037422A6F
MAEKVTIEDLDDVQDFLNKEDCLARLKYLGKQELVLVSGYLEIKIRESDSRVEILSKVHKHLKAGERQESEAQSTKESEVLASTEKEDKGRDGESDAGELNISFLTVKMRALEINREIEWKKLEIEREMKEKEMEMKRLELQEREKEREERKEEREREERRERERKEREREEKEEERQHELKVLRQKFRNLKKTSEHTFTEFANLKERLFQEWCASRKVKTKEQLEQLVLLEDFKECLFGDLKTILTDSADSSADKKHGATATEATEQEEGPHVQTLTDTQEPGVTADEYLRYGKVQCSLIWSEIPQTSEVDTPRVIAERGFSVIRNVGRPDGGRANTIFNVQAALLGLGVGLVSGYAVGTYLKTVAVTPNHQSPVFQVPVSLKEYRTEPKPNSFLVGRCYEPKSTVGAWSSDNNTICESAPKNPHNMDNTI